MENSVAYLKLKNNETKVLAIHPKKEETKEDIIKQLKSEFKDFKSVDFVPFSEMGD